ncbi:MAG: bifunctional metallophosphatase/5'-nucleotidase [Deltaproteobacteria bacterium]|nr:bifunctional metallophosphatase/5'-nucleotidase [Deltaproteobacteria bacterium]
MVKLLSEASWRVSALLLSGCCAAAPIPTDEPAAAPTLTWAAASPERRCAADKALATLDAAGLQALGLDAAAVDKILSDRGGRAPVGSLAVTLPESARDGLVGRVDAERHACGVVPVRLIGFNDFHGNLEPPSGKNGEITTEQGPVPAGGVEYLATWMERLRAEASGPVFVVSAGDNIGATPLISAAFHDEPAIEALNAVGLQVSSVGNHEFDEGIDELLRMQRGGCHPKDGCKGDAPFQGAAFEYLAANVVRDGGDETLFPAVTVRRVGRAEIAFIGMTLEGTPQIVTAAGVSGVRFLDEAETVNRLVPGLVARGVNAIVVLLHEGGFATGRYDGCEGISGPIFEIVEALDPAVDVVVSGHTNAAHVCDIGGRLVTSAAHAGRLLTAIDLELDELTGEVVGKRAKNVIVTRDVPKAPALTALVARWADKVAAYANVVVTTLVIDLTRGQDASGQSPLGMVIADAQLAAEAEPSGAEVALMNPGGVRADLLKGPVTYGALFAVQPFGNELVTMTLTGAELEAVLEEQLFVEGKARETPKMLQVSETLSYTINRKGPDGDKIATRDIRVAGKPIDPARGYRVVCNGFLAGGGDGFVTLKKGVDRKIGIVDLDALELYLKKRPALAAPGSGRVKVKP